MTSMMVPESLIHQEYRPNDFQIPSGSVMFILCFVWKPNGGTNVLEAKWRNKRVRSPQTKPVWFHSLLWLYQDSNQETQNPNLCYSALWILWEDCTIAGGWPVRPCSETRPVGSGATEYEGQEKIQGWQIQWVAPRFRWPRCIISYQARNEPYKKFEKIATLHLNPNLLFWNIKWLYFLKFVYQKSCMSMISAFLHSTYPN